MRKLTLLISVVCCCFAVHAQNGNRIAENQKMASTRQLQGAWTLEWMKDADVEKLYPAKKPVVNLNPTYGKIAGFNGCNNYFGSIKVQGNKITFNGPLGSTKMACKGVDEQKYMSAISQVVSFTVADSNHLELSTAQGPVLRFVRLPKQVPSKQK